MSENLLAVVIGGALTLIGGAAATLLAFWLDSRKAEQAHRRDRRAVQRTHAIEVVDAGRDWGTDVLATAMILGSDTTVTDLIDLDQWKSHQISTTRYRRALRASELVFSDATVRAIVRRLIDHLQNQHKVMEPLATKKLNGVRPTPAEGQAVLDFNGTHNELLDEFVVAATKFVD